VGYSRPIGGVTSNDVNPSREPVDTRGSLYTFLELLAGLPSLEVKVAASGLGVIALGAIVQYSLRSWK
jgi:hypothetical protein